MSRPPTMAIGTSSGSRRCHPMRPGCRTERRGSRSHAIYAVSATSLYALGVQAGYSWWQAAAVPVVADGPAIYGMFRIVSRSRRRAKGAGYGWLLVTCGTAASIGGNVAHAHPNLVAQAIAAAIPLAVLAMLEGLKGDAGEVTRLAAQAITRDGAGTFDPAGQLPQATTVRRSDPTTKQHQSLGTFSPGRRALPAGPAAPTANGTVGARLQAAYASRGRTDSPGPPAPWPRPPAVAAAAPPPSCNATVHRARSRLCEPAQVAVARRRRVLCLPGHPGAAAALSPSPPRRHPAGWRHPSADARGRLLVSGSGLRPACQASPGQPGPPWGQGRHHQPSPSVGLVDPPPPGQHRPRHRALLRRPGRRRPRRRPR